MDQIIHSCFKVKNSKDYTEVRRPRAQRLTKNNHGTQTKSCKSKLTSQAESFSGLPLDQYLSLLLCKQLHRSPLQSSLFYQSYP